jgi:endo-1,4-beta-xylanase
MIKHVSSALTRVFPRFGAAALAGLVVASVSGLQAQTITTNQTGNNNGFFYSLWHSTGSVSMTLGSAGNYALSWSSIGDVTAGKGWNPGSAITVGYNAGVLNGQKVFGVYGWTTGPLIEYYVVESGNQSGTGFGSLSSDGHTYNCAKHQQVNQPSIQGTQTFWQYFSNWGGTSTGSNHTVTMPNHINFWKAHGGQGFGSFNYMILLTEAWGGGSGNSNATVWHG